MDKTDIQTEADAPSETIAQLPVSGEAGSRLSQILFLVGIVLLLSSVVGFVYISTRFPRQKLKTGISKDYLAPPVMEPLPMPSPTRSKYPFTAEIIPQLSPFQCNWAGLFGGVYDLEGKPIVGYIIHIEGDPIDFIVISGDSQFVRVPGHDESSWDLVIDATGPTAGIWYVTLYEPGTNTPVSDVYEIRLEAMCGASSYFVKFIQNH